MKKTFLLRTAAAVCAAALALPLLASCTEGGGTESEVSEVSELSETAEVKTVTVGETVFELKNQINTEGTESGVYVFTPDYGKTSVPRPENGDFFDAVVLDNSVVAVYGRGSAAIIPDDGWLIRFQGVGDADIALGDKVDCELADIDSTPAKYVRFGDVVIEIGYENTQRTSEDIGWLYDSHWYSGTTTNNIYCTEIAVADGKIVEINRSGDNIGDTRIPKGGYVIALGQGSSSERKTQKLAVGDSAELFTGEKLYSVKRFGISGSNRSRPDDGLVVFTREKQSTTPVGTALTEVLVDKNSKVTAIYENCSGMNKIPEDGFILSATGTAATTLARNVRLGNTLFESGTRTLYSVSTPESLLARAKNDYEALKTRFDDAVGAISFIDFEAVLQKLDSVGAGIAQAETLLAAEGGFDGSALAEAILPVPTLLSELQAELIPSITVQDRAAWVTLGEYNHDNSILLHYRTQEDVDHTVAYAKSVGLNTLIIDNLAAGFAVYDSEVEGIVKLPQLGEVDLLAAFDKACDEQGIRLIIMVNAFSSGLDKVAYPSNHYMTVYKDKYLLTNKGNHVGPDGYVTLDPADKDVQAFNLAVLTEICEKYDVFGVQADYMRYPLPYYYQEHNYEDFGYNESSVSGFVKKYGKDPAKLKISDPLWEKWCAWRRDIISDYQKQFYQTAKSINPGLDVSFTCFADYRDRQLYTYQDVEKWAANGYADAIYPMIYGETTEYQLGYAQEILPVTEHTDLVLGVGTYVRATHESMAEQLMMSYDVCAEGISVFTLRYISICGYDELYRDVFRTPATPATAPDAELVPACADMIVARLENIAYAVSLSGEKGGELVGELADTVAAIGTENIAFSELCAQLGSIRADFAASAEGALSEKTLSAVLHIFDYVIGLQ